MPKTDDSPYSLKRLRELCCNIHDQQMAFLLRTTLADFPIPVIDEFFTGSKLNKPSGPDDREWTDIVRLSLIAFAPDGSEPARFRGKPIARYKRDYPFDENREDTDVPGKLTLYPVNHASPLLKEISTALGVRSLSIETKEWLSIFLCNPFPLNELKVRFTLDGGKWQPVAGLSSDYQEMFEVLPENLESLCMNVQPFLPFSGARIKRFKSLKKLDLSVQSLPDGIDFSENIQLEDLSLYVGSQGVEAIRGLGCLPSLQQLALECRTPHSWSSEGKIVDGSLEAITPLEPLEGLFSRGIEKIEINGVKYLSDKIKGVPAKSLLLKNTSGIKEVSFEHGASSEARIVILSSSLISLEVVNANELSVNECVDLERIKAHLKPKELQVKKCPKLKEIAISLEDCSPSNIEFNNLPLLSDIKLNADTVKMALNYSGKPVFRIICCGISRLPDFAGKWSGLKAIELVGNSALKSLSGIEALPELQILNINSIMENPPSGRGKARAKVTHEALENLFSSAKTSPMSSVSSVSIEHAPLKSLHGLETFPNLTSVVIQSADIDSLEGMENLSLLQKADLTDCKKIKSLAPLVGLGNLAYLKLSGCERIKPKPPHTVMEGPELLAEIARHAPPGKSVPKGAPSRELANIIELIGEGARSDVNHALQLLPALPVEEAAKLLAGAMIDPKTGWIRLPYLVRINEDEAKGIPQLQIVQAVGGECALKVFESITLVAINCDPRDDYGSTLCLGQKSDRSKDDGILEDFPSLSSLPSFPNLKGLHIRRLSHFSLEGAEKFSNVKSLKIENVSKIECFDSLRQFVQLEELSLCGLSSSDLMGLGSFPELKKMKIEHKLESLEGLENFPSLQSLQIRSTDDLSALFEYASRRNCRVAFNASGGEQGMFWGVGLEFRPKQ
jgi:hypothetical protein